jgi:LTXXQ motif family protein
MDEPNTSEEHAQQPRCSRSRRRGVKTSHLILLGVAIAAGTALLVTGLRAADGRPGDGGPMLAGWHGGGHGPGRFAERLCSDERDTMLEDRLSFVESFARFTDAQQPAWQQLTAAVRAGSGTVGEACAQFETLQEQAQAPARMAQVELVLSTALEVVQEVRPAFDDFYAVLDEDQKAALDKMANRHRH